MALASNALTTLANLQAYMGRGMPDTDLFAVYHNGLGDATACTVVVGEWVSGVSLALAVRLTVTGGAGAGAYTYYAFDKPTLTEMAVSINAENPGGGTGEFIARAIAYGGASTSRLNESTSVSCYESASEQYLRGTDDYAYAQAINAASAMMERRCGRNFASADYVQAYHGTDRPTLRLHEYPVTKLARIVIGRQEAIAIRNTSTDAADATIRVDGTNAVCTIIGGANNGSDDVAISTKTITELATAITALGKGWTATAGTSAGMWLASEILRQSASGCLQGDSHLYVPEETDNGAQCEFDTGIVTRGPFYSTQGPWGHYLPHLVTRPGLMHHAPVWPAGRFNVFAEYTAGYSTTPDDLAMLCNELSASILRTGTRDTGLSAETGGGYSYTATGDLWMSEGFQKRLSPWRSLLSAEYRDV